MLQRIGARFGAVAFILGMIACGPAPDGEWIGLVTDSSGIEIVANPISGLWRMGGGWQVEEALRIGAADGEAAYQFGRIGGIDADGRGRVYVLDQQAAEVRVFDADGRFLHTIGRKGDGPGELSDAASAVFIGAGDTLFVPDPRLRRVNRFLPDGTPVGHFPIPMADGLTVRWQVTPEGRLAQQVRSIAFPSQEDDTPRHDVVLLRGTDGTVHDTLLTFPPGEASRVSGGMPSFRFFDAEPTWTVDTFGRVIHGLNVEYNLHVEEPGVGTVRIFRKPTARKRLTDSDRERILELLRTTVVDLQGNPPIVWETIRPAISFTDYYPAFNEILAGPEGTLLVQQLQTAQEAISLDGGLAPQALGAPRWDVFDADGRFLGVLELPDRFQPVRVRGDRIYGIWRDEMDVEHVLGLRIVETGGQMADAPTT